MVLETWFIAVLAAVSALIVILTVIIVVLCVLWCKRRDTDNNNQTEHPIKHPVSTGDRSNSPSFTNEVPHSRNWLLLNPGKKSTPVSPENSRPSIAGNEASIVGTSIVKLSEELDKTAARKPSVNSVQKFGVSDYRNWGSETSEERRIRLGLIPPRSSGRFELSSQASSTNYTSQGPPPYSKPRITNVQISYNTIETGSDKPSHNAVMLDKAYMYSPSQTCLPYVIPEEDYSNSEVVYSREERSSYWQDKGLQHRNSGLTEGKVKNIAANFETPERPTSHVNVQTPSRPVSRNESKVQEPKPLPKHFSVSADSVVSSTGVTSDGRVTHVSRDMSGQHPNPVNWQGQTAGARTIEDRLRRIKKLGGVSILPE